MAIDTSGFKKIEIGTDQSSNQQIDTSNFKKIGLINNSLKENGLNKVDDRSFLGYVGQFGKEVGKSAGRSILGAGKLGLQMLPGDSENTPIITPIKKGFERDIKRLKMGEGAIPKVATAFENVAEFLTPTGLVGGAAKVVSGISKAAKLGEGASKFAKFAGQSLGLGAESAAIGSAQKGSTEDIGSQFLAGAAVPTAIKGAGVLFKGAKETGKYLTSKVTGLSRETIDNVLKSPEYFTGEAVKKASTPEARKEFGETIKSVISKRQEDLSSVGKGYDAIRAIKTPVKFESNPFKEVLAKNQIAIDKSGKLMRSTESTPLSDVDIAALEKFYADYGRYNELSPNAILNARSVLSKKSNYTKGETDNLDKIFRDLRGAYDNSAKSQIKGLKELDAKYSPEKTILKSIEKDLYDKQGNFKDSALTTLANLSSKGSEAKLARLEKLMPNVGRDSQVLKAVEDIIASSGNKVGTYANAIGLGLLGSNVADNKTGITMGVLGLMVAQPKVAINILKTSGYSQKVIDKVMNGVINSPFGKLIKTKLGEGIDNAKPSQVGSKVKELIENVKSNKGFVTPEGLTFGLAKGDDLLKEAKKYKSAEEFVKSKIPSGRMAVDGNNVVIIYPDGSKSLYSNAPNKNIAQKIANEGNLEFINPEYNAKKIYREFIKGDGYTKRSAEIELAKLKNSYKDLDLRIEGNGFRSGENRFKIVGELKDQSNLAPSLEDIWYKANKGFVTPEGLTFGLAKGDDLVKIMSNDKEATKYIKDVVSQIKKNISSKDIKFMENRLQSNLGNIVYGGLNSIKGKNKLDVLKKLKTDSEMSLKYNPELTPIINSQITLLNKVFGESIPAIRGASDLDLLKSNIDKIINNK